MFRGQPAAAANSTPNAAVVWAGIPIVPPGTNNTRTFRITNVRANAAGVPASTSLVPTQIFAFLSISASQSLALNNPQQAVAFVLPGLQFDVRSCSGGSPSASFVQCTSQNGSLFTNPSATGTFGSQLGLRFREGFQTAFKTRLDPSQGLSVPGVVYNTESGFVRTDRPELAGVGIADAATRVAARFTNVPAGTRIFREHEQRSVWYSTAISVRRQLRLSSFPQMRNGAGGSVATSVARSLPVGVAATTLSELRSNNSAAAAAEVPLTAGAGMAVWEVTAANSANIDTLFFYMAVAYTREHPEQPAWPRSVQRNR